MGALSGTITKADNLTEQTTVEWELVPATSNSLSAADLVGGLPQSGTATFGPNIASVVISPPGFAVVDDGLVEGTEKAIFRIKNPSNGGVLDGASVELSVTDNDAPPSGNLVFYGNVQGLAFTDVGQPAMAVEFDIPANDNKEYYVGIGGKDADHYSGVSIKAGSGEWTIGKENGNGSYTADFTGAFQNDPGPKPWRAIVESVGNTRDTVTVTIKLNGVTVFTVDPSTGDAFWPQAVRGNGLTVFATGDETVRNLSAGTR